MEGAVIHPCEKNVGAFQKKFFFSHSPPLKSGPIFVIVSKSVEYSEIRKYFKFSKLLEFFDKSLVDSFMNYDQ